MNQIGQMLAVSALPNGVASETRLSDTCRWIEIGDRNADYWHCLAACKEQRAITSGGTAKLLGIALVGTEPHALLSSFWQQQARFCYPAKFDS